MIRRIFIAFSIFSATAIAAFSQTVEQLPTPDKSLGVTLMEAMQNRRSERDFDPNRQISAQQLSQILWAACGINREERGGLLTIPTATNSQDIKVYVCRESGVSLYDPRKNTLTKVSDKDLRGLLAQDQASMRAAPVFLLLVSDQTKFRRDGEHWGAMNTGYASENICLMCSALGLKTVPRGIMDKEGVAKVLGLPETTVVELNHPVGY